MIDPGRNLRFHDLEIHIGSHRTGEGYPVALILDEQRLLPRGVLPTDIGIWRQTRDPEVLGRALMNRLLTGDHVRRAWEQAKERAPRRRLRLRIDPGADELQSLPWELLCEATVPLAASDDTPFARYLPSDDHQPAPLAQRPLRLVVVTLSAHPDRVGDAGARFTEILRKVPGIEVSTLASPTDAELEACRSQRCDILHVVVPAGVGRAAREPSARWPVEEDDATWVPRPGLPPATASLMAVTRALDRLDNPPRLVVLEGLETQPAAADDVHRPQPDHTRGLSSIAQSLVSAGIPAAIVIETTGRMARDEGADPGPCWEARKGFARTLYHELGCHGIVDRAMNTARKDRRGPASVLFTRLLDGQLWRLAPRHDAYRHISPPDEGRFFERADEIASLRSRLLEEGTPELLVCGPAGSGKTVLARALCDDPEIQAAFGDGILWATLGEAPDTFALLHRWLTALGSVDVSVPGTATERGARAVLDTPTPTLAALQRAVATELTGKACLLVLDDARAAGDVEVLRAAVLGSEKASNNCRLLITSRDGTLAETLGCESHELMPMPAEALEAVLTAWGGEVVAGGPAEARKGLVAALGGLPGAAALAGAFIRQRHPEPETWPTLFAVAADSAGDALTEMAFAEGALGGDALGGGALSNVIARSVGSLSDRERRCCLALAAFWPQEAIPLHVVTRLWSALVAGPSPGPYAPASPRQRVAASSLADLEPVLNVPPISETTTELSSREPVDANQGISQGHRPDLDVVGLAAGNIALEATGRARPEDDKGSRGERTFPQTAVASKATPAERASMERASMERASMETAPTEAASEAVLRQLRALGLVRVGEEGRALSIPAAVHDFASAALSPAELQQVHWALLQSYNPDHRPWAEIRDEGYLYDHLAYHLSRVGRRDAATNLLADDAWLRSRIHRDGGSYTGYLSDLRIAQAEARDRTLAQVATSGSPTALIDCLRFALVRTSLNSLPARLPAPLVGPAVTQAGWSAIDVICDAERQVPAERAAALRQLLVALPPRDPDFAAVEQAALGAVIGMARRGDASGAARALATLAPYLAPSTLPGAVDLAWAVPGVASEARLRLTSLPDAEAGVTGQADDAIVHQARALAGLIPCLEAEAGARVQAQALAALHATEDAAAQTAALGALARGLTSPYLLQALAVATTMSHSHRGAALAALTPHLAQAPDAADLLLRALRATGTLPESADRAQVLVALIPHLARQPQATRHLARALDAARNLDDERDEALVLAVLAPYLPPFLLESAVTTAQGILDAPARVRAIAALAPRLPEEPAPPSEPEDDEDAPPTRASLLADALDDVARMGWEVDRAEALAHLAPVLPTPLVPRALGIAGGIGPSGSQNEVLLLMTSQLSETQMAAALRSGGSEMAQAHRLAALVPHLPERMLPEANALAAQLSAPAARVVALRALAERAPRSVAYSLISEGLSAAEAIASPSDRADALAALAPHLPPDLIGEALDIAQGIAHPAARARAMTLLVPRMLVMGDLGRWIRTRLGDRDIGDRAAQAAVLGRLLPHTGKALRERLTMALLAMVSGEELPEKAHDKRQSKVDLFTTVASACPPSLLPRVLDATRALPEDRDRGRVIVAVAPRLSDPALTKAENLVAEIADDRVRIETQMAILPRLGMWAQRRALGEVRTAAEAIQAPYEAALAWSAIAAQSVWPARGRMIERAAEAANAVSDPVQSALAWASVAGLSDPASGSVNAIQEGVASAVRRLGTHIDRTPSGCAARADAVKALVSLAQYLDPGTRPRVLTAALDELESLQRLDERQGLRVLLSLVTKVGGDHLPRLLGLACRFQEPDSRADALVALAPRLAGHPALADTCRAAAAAIEPAPTRLRVSVACLPLAENRAEAVDALRSDIAAFLCRSEGLARSDLLRFIAETGAFTPAILGLTAEAFDALVETVIDVCTNWDWL